MRKCYLEDFKCLTDIFSYGVMQSETSFILNDLLLSIFSYVLCILRQSLGTIINV